MFIGWIAPGLAKRGTDLFCGVILYRTLLNEVGESIREHILEDLVFLDGGSEQLPETKRAAASHCEDRSGAVAFGTLA